MNKKKYRLSDIISVAGLLVIIYGFAVSMILSPDKTFSEDENRTLQTFPRFSFESLTNGEFAEKISKYCADQMPLRSVFIDVKAAAETLLGKVENNNVVIGNDGYIIAKSDYTDFTDADKNLGAIKEFAESNEVQLRVAIAGRSQDVLLRYMPELYPAKEVSDGTFAHVTDGLDGITQIDLLEPLRQRADEGEYVYYRTDHHWTTLGAYYAYVEIMDSYGLEPYPLEYFTPEVVSEEFYGTTWSKAGMKWVSPDTMEFFRFEGDDAYVTEIVERETSFDGFYDRSYLEKKDKYSAFIGGNSGRVRITAQDGKERETLVLIKDSFGHSLAPFLAMHFDLDILDLRYYTAQSVSDVIAESGAGKVLIIYNLDSVLSGDTLVQLNVEME
ncbi:MAG: hypothetical protein IJY93_06795 [Clostridia bacterium]|nr:hypothetical protein [Clostridia bacterium]